MLELGGLECLTEASGHLPEIIPSVLQAAEFGAVFYYDFVELTAASLNFVP